MSLYGVFFCGLIMHIGETTDGPKVHSALVHDTRHDRILKLEHEEIDISAARTIEIVGLPPAPAALDNTFIDLVPSVDRIMGGRLESDAKDGTSNDAAFFRHVGGTLFAGFPYPKLARHIRTGLNGTVVARDGEVATLTAVIFAAPDGVALTIKAGAVERPFPPNSAVTVGNFDRPVGNHDPAWDPHFNKYRRLTNFSNPSISMEVHAAVAPLAFSPAGVTTPQWVLDIILTGIGVLTAAHPECGNSAWP